ncbi:MAG TPA: DUF2911 domain-containing protein [Gemmatimonadales bacterium]
MRSTLLLLLLASPLAAQGGATAGFVTRLGRDTVALERITRTGSRLTGDLFTTSPRTRRVHYVATLDAKGRVSRLEVTSVAAVETPPSPALSIVEHLGDTLATVIITRGTSKPDTVRMKVRPGATPFLALSTGLLEQMAMQARRARTDSLAFDMIVAGQRAPQANYVARRGRDSVAIDYFGLPFYLRVDSWGRVLGLNGMRTTQKFLVERVSTLDLEGLSGTFVARERAGQVAGQMSPRDTARAIFEAPAIVVDYGRPAKRGREIFGNIVPWNQVWRTGANAATQLITPMDLVVGDQVIPAGKYTLWTLPTPTGVKLIVNKQTGQWGTEYDPAQDLVRLDLRLETLPQPVERFTIAVVSLGKAGEIHFDWDMTRWILPFVIR